MSGVTWNDVTKTSKDLALIKHKDKSDEELQSIIRHCSIISQSGDVATMAKALGEMQGCSEILEQRRKKEAAYTAVQEAVENAREVNWFDQLQNRQMNAIRNLPHAASYHGQLVAAVLGEEDGLSKDAIRSWSDELAAMEDESYNALLAGLVNEGILALNDNGTYSLLRICTEDLFPENPLQWAEKVFARQGKRLTSEQRVILLYLAQTRQPISEFEALDLVGSNAERAITQKRPDSPRCVIPVQTLVSFGVLTPTRIPGTNAHLFYFPMLGEHKEGAV